MSIQIKLKNSVVQDSTPSASDLPEVGELAVNGNINSIGGFMRASDNSIVKIFGPGSVTTPTATTTVSGISELATNSETTTGTATNRVVTPAGLNAVTTAERTTSNNNYVAKAGSTMTGVLTMPNGSNSAPAINFGDSDSGIFGGTNTVSLAAGGGTKLTANATGIGIGAAASALFHVTATNPELRIQGTNGNGATHKIFTGGLNSESLQITGNSNLLLNADVHFFRSSNEATEYARIDSSGRLLIGTSSSRAAGPTQKQLQIEGTNGASSSLSLIRNQSNTEDAVLYFAKTRHATVGGSTIVQSGDKLGDISFAGADGTDIASVAARIQAFVDGTPGANDMPGRLVFSTTADGAASPTERLRIDSSGNVGIGTTSPVFPLETVFTNANSSSFSTSLAMGSAANADLYALHLQNLGTGNCETGLLFSSGNTQFGQWSVNCLKTGAFVGDLAFRTRTGSATSAERMRITSSGNVGIGTASPKELSGQTHLTINQAATGTQVAGIALRIGDSDGGTIVSYPSNNEGLRLTTFNADKDITFFKNISGSDTELMRIETSGHVGIGTSSPEEILHIHESSNSPCDFRLSNNEGYGFLRSDSNLLAYNAQLHLFANRDRSTEYMRLDTSGRLGIGTSSPNSSTLLHISTAQSGSAAGTGITLSGWNGSAESRVQIMSYGIGNGTLAIRNTTSNTEVLRIDDSGNVGIGTTSPQRQLHVTNSSGDALIRITSANGSAAYVELGDASDGDAGKIVYDNGDNLTFATANSGTTTEKLRIKGNGNVGINNTSPNAKLDVGGTINVGNVGSNTSATNNLIQGYGYRIGAALYGNVSIRSTYTSNTNSGSLDFYTGSGGQSTAERMRITPSGNVGIGTSSPTSLLTINHATNPGIRFEDSGTKVASINAEGTATNIASFEGKALVFATSTSSSFSERMRIDSSGRLLINTTNNSNGHISASNLTVQGGDLSIFKDSGGDNPAVSAHKLKFVTQSGSLAEIDAVSEGAGGPGGRAGAMRFYTKSNNVGAAAERMRIDSSGKVGIGTTSPNFNVEVAASGGGDGATLGISNTGADPAGLRLNSGHGNWSVYNSKTIGDALEFRDETANSTRMIINSSGDIGIGTTSPTTGLHVNGTARVNQFLVNVSGVHNSARITVKGHTTGSHSNIQCQNSDGTQLFLVRNDNHTFVGTLSKSAGSFFIDHPLPSLAATKTLRHSFIEGPQCDNIYRGKVTLSSGTASINLDTVSKMTEGTFVVLNRDVQCFTTNETGFDSVKGSVENNILTIICENNSSTDTISWMVVGERQDPSIKTAGITDDEGYLLVEEDKIAV